MQKYKLLACARALTLEMGLIVTMANALSRIKKLLFSSALFSIAFVMTGLVGVDVTRPVLGATEDHPTEPQGKPKLVVQLLFDQGRFDYKFGGPRNDATNPDGSDYTDYPGFKRHPGGVFDKFYQEGIVFDYGEYVHSATYTAQGFSTISTGAESKDHKLPHSHYHIYDNMGYSSAGINTFDGVNAKSTMTTGMGTTTYAPSLTTNIDPVVAVPTRWPHDNFDTTTDTRISVGAKLTHIMLRQTLFDDAHYPDLGFKFQDNDGKETVIEVGSRSARQYSRWVEIPVEIIGEIKVYSKDDDTFKLKRIEFLDHHGNSIQSQGRPVADTETLRVDTQTITGAITGGKGSGGDWTDKIMLVVEDQEPGQTVYPGEIQTLSDSFAKQFSGSKIFALGAWSYPVAPISGQHGKAFWLGDATGGWNKEGVFRSSRDSYPDGLPAWMTAYNTKDNKSPVKRVLDHLAESTVAADRAWKINKCSPSYINDLDEEPCWNWNTLYDSGGYINYPYDDDNRGDGIRYETSQAKCGVWEMGFQRYSNFPYRVGTHPVASVCEENKTVNRMYNQVGSWQSVNGWGQNANQTLLYSALESNVLVDAAKELITQEGLGQDNTPDLLTFYVGSMDMVGHVFGIDSLEYEDAFYRTDKALGELMAWIDDRVGADNVLYVLASDHGMDSTPEYQATAPQHLQDFHNESSFTTGRLMQADIKKQINDSLEATLKEVAGANLLYSSDFVIDMITHTVYLDLRRIAVDICQADRLDTVHGNTPGATAADKTAFDHDVCRHTGGQLIHTVAPSNGQVANTALLDTVYFKHIIDEMVRKFTTAATQNTALAGVAAAYSYNTLLHNPSTITEPGTKSGRYDDSIPMQDRVTNMYVHGRSGQIMVIPKPHYYYYHSEGYAAMHSTPYWYDRYAMQMYRWKESREFPDDKHRIRNFAAVADGSKTLGQNSIAQAANGIHAQQHNIVPTIGKIMGIDYDNLPQAYRDRVGGSGNYVPAFNLKSP